MGETRQAGAAALPAGAATASRRRRGLLVLLLGCVAIAAPFVVVGAGVFTVLGIVLAVSGGLEIIDGFHAGEERARRLAFTTGALSLAGGLLLLARPLLA